MHQINVMQSHFPCEPMNYSVHDCEIQITLHVKLNDLLNDCMQDNLQGCYNLLLIQFKMHCRDANNFSDAGLEYIAASHARASHARAS